MKKRDEEIEALLAAIADDAHHAGRMAAELGVKGSPETDPRRVLRPDWWAWHEWRLRYPARYRAMRARAARTWKRRFYAAKAERAAEIHAARVAAGLPARILGNGRGPRGPGPAVLRWMSGRGWLTTREVMDGTGKPNSHLQRWFVYWRRRGWVERRETERAPVVGDRGPKYEYRLTASGEEYARHACEEDQHADDLPDFLE